MNKIKKILVPIDFTLVAFNALRYACMCFPDAEISVVHVVSPSLNSSEISYSVLKRFSTVDDKMKAMLISSIKNELGVSIMPDRISVEVLKGEVIPTLKNFLSENNFDCLVMGTRDKYDIFDKVIGTVSLAIVKSIDCPVYLIPKYAIYQGFNKIMVAADNHLLHNEVGTRIKEWNADHNAFVKFLHIDNSKVDDNFGLSEEKLLVELFEGNDPTFGFSMESVKSKSIGTTLLDLAYKYGADLLVGMPDKQNFISSLIYKSVTKDLIQKSSIPLLFIHPLESII